MLKHENLSTGSGLRITQADGSGTGTPGRVRHCRSTDLGGSGWQQCRARLDGSSELGPAGAVVTVA